MRVQRLRPQLPQHAAQAFLHLAHLLAHRFQQAQHLVVAYVAKGQADARAQCVDRTTQFVIEFQGQFTLALFFQPHQALADVAQFGSGIAKGAVHQAQLTVALGESLVAAA